MQHYKGSNAWVYQIEGEGGEGNHDDAGVTMMVVSACPTPGLPSNSLFSTAHQMVDHWMHLAGGAAAPVVHMQAARHPRSAWVVRSLHVLDIRPSSEVDQQASHEVGHDWSVQQLLDRAPQYRECWQLAQQLVDAAQTRGAKAYVTWNEGGSGAFRLWVMPEQSHDLFVKVQRNRANESWQRPVQSFFTLPEMPPILHCPMRVKLLQCQPLLTKPSSLLYSSEHVLPDVQQVMRAFYTQYAQCVTQRDWNAAGHDLWQSMDQGEEQTRDIVDLLASQQWTATAASLAACATQDDDDDGDDEGGEDQIEVTVRLESHHRWVCPRTHAVHAEVDVRVHRQHGTLCAQCADPACAADRDYQWPTVQVAGYPGPPSALMQFVLHDNPLMNQVTMARFLAPLLRDQLAYDDAISHGSKWRAYDGARGTWKATVTKSSATLCVHDCLKQHVDQYMDQQQQQMRDWPQEHPLREKVQQQCNKVRKLLSKMGRKTYVTNVVDILESLLLVDEKLWQSHFAAHLAVSNVLLHFCCDSGQVQALPYRPQYYVRQEYQATGLMWDPQARSDKLDHVLNQWWDAQERDQWMETLAYGLSRTGFAEKGFAGKGLPGSAKSTLTKVLIDWFGAGNVFVHTGTDLLAKPSARARSIDGKGKGHDSSLMVCYDKAIVFFPEPKNGAVWRDEVFKRMTGDKQSGRHAHATSVDMVRRTYIVVVLCNFVPQPENPQDPAMERRLEILTSHRVFYSSKKNKKDTKKRMTPQQREEAKFIKAETSVIDELLQDQQAASAFLNHIAAAWTKLIVQRKKVFYRSDNSKLLLKQYWSQHKAEQDSVSLFLETQVQLTGKDEDVMPKQSLWLAYRQWLAREERVNGIPGRVADSDLEFKTRAKQYYTHTNIKSKQRTTHVYEQGPAPNGYQQQQQHPFNNGNRRRPVVDVHLQVSASPLARVHCFLGIKLINPPADQPPLLYPSLKQPKKDDDSNTNKRHKVNHHATNQST